MIPRSGYKDCPHLNKNRNIMENIKLHQEIERLKSFVKINGNYMFRPLTEKLKFRPLKDKLMNFVIDNNYNKNPEFFKVIATKNAEIGNYYIDIEYCLKFNLNYDGSKYYDGISSFHFDLDEQGNIITYEDKFYNDMINDTDKRNRILKLQLEINREL